MDPTTQFWVTIIGAVVSGVCSVLAAVGTLVIALRQGKTHAELVEVKKIVNGRWTESVAASGTAGEARGNLAGRAEQTQENKET